MKSNDDYLTQISEDWPASNRLHLQLFIRYAYANVKEITMPSRNPMFATPNKAFLSGMLRFGAFDYFLERACEMKLLKNIVPNWIQLSDTPGGVQALELRGKYTSLIAHHLADPREAPRGSTLRDDKRLQNQLNPCFNFFSEPEPQSSLLNLTLVHGDKAAEFAYFHIYHDSGQPGQFIRVSENIMQMLPLSTSGDGGVEEIADAEVKLKQHLIDFKKRQAEAE